MRFLIAISFRLPWKVKIVGVTAKARTLCINSVRVLKNRLTVNTGLFRTFKESSISSCTTWLGVQSVNRSKSKCDWAGLTLGRQQWRFAARKNGWPRKVLRMLRWPLVMPAKLLYWTYTTAKCPQQLNAWRTLLPYAAMYPRRTAGVVFRLSIHDLSHIVDHVHPRSPQSTLRLVYVEFIGDRNMSMDMWAFWTKICSPLTTSLLCEAAPLVLVQCALFPHYKHHTRRGWVTDSAATLLRAVNREASSESS